MFIHDKLLFSYKQIIKMENLTLNKTSLAWLFQTARWAKFIAIIGYILIGFLILVGIFIGFVLNFLNQDMANLTQSPQISSTVLAIIYVGMAILYFFPVHYLFQFSNRFINAFKAEDEESLNASFEYLKMHYKFIGILMIVMLVIYALLFLGAILAAVMGLV